MEFSFLCYICLPNVTIPARGPQFSMNEDFDDYPRQRAADRAMLQQAGCAAVFEPDSLYASRE